MTLSDAARAQIAAAKERQGGAYLAGRAPLPGTGFGARTLGDLAIIEPGCTIWAHTEGVHARVDSQGEAKGGVVLDVTATTGVDNETGEMWTRRAFDCFNPYASLDKAFRKLTEAQIDPERSEGPDQLLIRNGARRIGAAAAKNHGIMFPFEVELWHNAWRLAAIIGLKWART